jgi:tetratricopeptide (TPR) repeat protein
MPDVVHQLRSLVLVICLLSGPERGRVTAQEPNPVEEFVAHLRALREEAGNPSLDRLVELTRGTECPLTRSTTNDKLLGKTVIAWETVRAFVTACAVHAESEGIALGKESVDVSGWDSMHAQMLDRVADGRIQARHAKAAREEIARRAARLAAADASSGGTSESRPPVVNLPARNPLFTGRADLLRELATRLETGPVAVAAMRGLGGIGKSSLALEYAYQARDSGRYAIVWWVRADSPLTLHADLAALAAELGVGPGGDEQETVRALVRALAIRDDWLIVYDNAEGPQDLSGMLPGSGRVLITSRLRMWSGIAASVDVTEFSPDESVAFLVRRSGHDEPRAAASLAGKLGHLPLALAQAAAYADTYDVSLAYYLDLYRDAAERMLATGLDPTEYPHSVATTWLLHVDQLRRHHPAALELLRVCAFLAPTAIPLGFIFSGHVRMPQVLAPAVTDPVMRAETVGALVRTSLVSRPADEQIQIHRLVQAITRHQFDDEQKADYLHGAGAIVATSSPENPSDPDSWVTGSQWAPHALAVAQHEEQPHPAGARGLYHYVAMYLYERGEYENAERVVARAQGLPADDRDAEIAGLDDLRPVSAMIKMKRGDLDGARQDLLHVVREQEERNARPDPLLGQQLIDLAIIERRLMKLGDAYRHLTKAHQIAVAAGEEELAVMAVINKAQVRQAAGDLESARDMHQQVLNWRRSHCRADDHRIAVTLGNLGTIYAELGEKDAAVNAIEEALHIFELRLGPDHPEVGTALLNLGSQYAELGNLDKAERLLERALTIGQARHGRQTPQVAGILSTLAQIHHQHGKTEDARRLATEALQIFQATLGPHHPESIKTRLVLERVLRI